MMEKLLQLTLDLFAFDPAPQPRQKPKASKPRQPRSAPQGEATADLLGPVRGAAPAPVVDERQHQGPHLPAQTLEQVLAPATFSHPQATRQALVSGVVVAYAFRRGKRRTIGFSVGADGLTVSAPKWVPLNEIDRSVQEKGDWILKKLHETRARHQRLESARIIWQNGALIPYLGTDILLVLDPSHGFTAAGAQLMPPAANGADPASGPMTLRVGLPHSASPEQVRDVAQAWLMRQAKHLFVERLDHFAPQLGVRYTRLSLSSAGTRWGSASADGSIRLNWRLIHFKHSVIDYVVVHELSHLRVMDHSPRFWDTVRSIVPDYVELRGQLKEEPIPKW